MNRKQIQHIRDLNSKRLLATVVAFDTPDGVKVGWSIANWSTKPHPDGLLKTQQPTKKSGVAFASLNARIGNNPTVRRKAYVKFSFVKTELMQEIYEIAENLRNFLETPKRQKTSGGSADGIGQSPFDKDLRSDRLVDDLHDCQFWECFDYPNPSSKFGNIPHRQRELEKLSVVVADCFNSIAVGLKQVDEVFTEFCKKIGESSNARKDTKNSLEPREGNDSPT